MTAQTVAQKPLVKTRLIMYHKTPTSGLTKFLRQDNKTICMFEALPKLSVVLDDDERPVDEKLLSHPSPLIKQAADWLGLTQDDFELESEFCEKVDVSDGPVTVYLARFTTIDPPQDYADKVGGKFITLMDAIGLPPAEMELLRRAYKVIMEG